MRILNRGRSAQRPSVAGRLFGAGVAAAVGALCAAMAVGNLADVVLEQLPADHASPVLAAVRRPVEVVRACRLLATVTGPEAEILLDRGDIRGVLESESIDRLLRTPGVVRKVSRAADGDWAALATLAADPAVKEFMNEGDFLDRIRALDMVSMADDIRRRRSTGEQLAAASARAAAARGSVSSPPRVLNESWARRIAEDPQLRDRVLAEWFDERKQPAPRNASPPQTAAHPAQATPAEVEAYWRKVGALLEFADGPNLPASLIPGFSPPAPEPAK
jgi:hypothetical protein